MIVIFVDGLFTLFPTGDAGPIFSKSTKQRIVTKSSTEAELVGLSDTASQAIVIVPGFESVEARTGRGEDRC